MRAQVLQETTTVNFLIICVSISQLYMSPTHPKVELKHLVDHILHVTSPIIQQLPFLFSPVQQKKEKKKNIISSVVGDCN